MAKTKKHTTLYDYLHDTGVLESGDTELIQKIKAAYWRKYHKDYKREKRSRDKEYVIVLDKSEQEILKTEADKHCLSLSLFIKQSSLAYVHQEYIRPDAAEIARIEQTLSLCYTGIERLIHSQSHEPAELCEALDAIIRIENRLDELSMNPPRLEQAIKNALDAKPYYIETLKKLIEAHDHQK